MNVYTLSDIGESIKDNSYVGRGIVIGKSADAEGSACNRFTFSYAPGRASRRERV